ncbi:hypothetical protein Tco_0477118, partial [Tanacetum coccineum]
LGFIAFKRDEKWFTLSADLFDEDVEAQQESVPQEEGDDPDLKLAKKMSLEAASRKGRR